MSTPVAVAGIVAVYLAWVVFTVLWFALFDWLKLRISRRMGVPVDEGCGCASAAGDRPADPT